MNKPINKWVFFSITIWLLICQITFYFIQFNVSEKNALFFNSQLRQELQSSDFNFISKSINDMTYLGIIKCAKLTKLSPENIKILNMEYPSSNCQNSFLTLDGIKRSVNLNSLNGDKYNFSFVSTNTQYFYITLWCLRIFGSLGIILLQILIELKNKEKILNLEMSLKINQEVNDLALRLSHDIRSPLAVLKSFKEELSKSSIDLNQFDLALERINLIANDLLKKDKDIQIISEPFLLNDFIEIQVQQKNIEQQTKINFINNTTDLQINVISKIELSRVISNLLNNSIEATKSKEISQVEVKLNYIIDHAEVLISDNGPGIPDHILNNLGKKRVSSKKNISNSGSGMGILSAMETIKNCGGNLTISSDTNIGTTIKILLPIELVKSKIENLKTLKTILVDDDSLTRFNWEYKAKKKNIELVSFSSASELKLVIDTYDKESQIYIDSELGNEKGEDLAKELYLKNFSNIFITSGHPKEKFSHLPFLKGIIGKNPPF